MIVNVEEMGKVYDELGKKVISTLEALLNSFAITEKERAQVISSTISSLIQVSVSSVLDQPVKDAQISASKAQELASKVQGFVALANSQKENELKEAQKELANTQKDIFTREIVIKEAQNTKDSLLKDAQKTFIDMQKETEVERKALLIRQKDFYNDQGKMKEAEFLSGMVQMALVSGSTPDSTMVSKAYSAIDAITP